MFCYKLVFQLQLFTTNISPYCLFNEVKLTNVKLSFRFMTMLCAKSRVDREKNMNLTCREYGIEPNVFRTV